MSLYNQLLEYLDKNNRTRVDKEKPSQIDKIYVVYKVEEKLLRLEYNNWYDVNVDACAISDYPQIASFMYVHPRMEHKFYMIVPVQDGNYTADLFKKFLRLNYNLGTPKYLTATDSKNDLCLFYDISVRDENHRIVVLAEFKEYLIANAHKISVSSTTEVLLPTRLTIPVSYHVQLATDQSPLMIHETKNITQLSLDIMSPQNYVYIVQMTKRAPNGNVVYKVGQTSCHIKKNMGRKEYKGCICLYSYKLRRIKCIDMERIMIPIFDRIYVHRPDFGREYYESHPDMIPHLRRLITEHDV